MKWNAIFKDGRLEIQDRQGFVSYMTDSKKKKLAIELADTPPSNNLRGFYFSAVIPQLRQTCDLWQNIEGEVLHEMIKKMFHYEDVFNPITNRVERVGKPTMSCFASSKKAMEFLELVRQYLADCGIEMANPESFKQERDSAETL